MAYQLPTHILRLGDVYLVGAEASLLSGNADDALTYVNKIRERAGAELLSSVTIQDIWKERRLELAGEGDYWYDFVRRSYYAMDDAIEELLAQKRNQMYSYDAVCADYFEGATVGAGDKMDYSACEWNPDPSSASVPSNRDTYATGPYRPHHRLYGYTPMGRPTYSSILNVTTFANDTLPAL